MDSKTVHLHVDDFFDTSNWASFLNQVGLVDFDDWSLNNYELPNEIEIRCEVVGVDNKFTKNERIKKMQSFRKRKFEEKIEAERRSQTEREEMLKKIKDLSPVIQEMIDVANECFNCNIPLMKNSGFSFRCYENKYFMANPVSHRVGFMWDAEAKDGKYVYEVAILGDSGYLTDSVYSSNVDLFVSPKRLLCFDNYDKACVSPPNWLLKKFINDFDKFKNAFYKYVDEFIESE